MIASFKGKHLCGICFVAFFLSACMKSEDRQKKLSPEAIHQQDLYVVDCLLPGQVRRLGSAQYITPRRAIKTTAHDCEIRGGEYVAYDRSNYQSALNMWLPLAVGGDKKAQNYVGEIYEKGLGADPDYAQASYWYIKAANQGFARAQINAGLLYEKGKGVERNLTKALEYYRLAAGVDESAVLLSREAKLALEKEASDLKQKLAQANKAVSHAQQALVSAKNKNKAINQADQHVNALRALYDHSLTERTKLQSELQSMSLAYRNFSQSELLAPSAIDLGDPTVLEGINFGRYYALIIGNQSYQFLDDLRSPVRDAKRLQKVLEQRYGFTTQIIQNGSEKDLLMAMNTLFNELGPNDNLLIFYAGHGELSRSGLSQVERGYWLPVDAQANNISHWINNAVISDHLDRLKVRSVLVISDSCFAGYLGEDKSPYLFGLSRAKLSRATIERDIKRRARIVISSGGERPVLDGSNTDHSIFAGALIEALEQNDRPLRDSQLFSLLSVNVGRRAQSLALMQEPEMKPVREAGHEGGSFYFIPKLMVNQ